MIYSEIPDFGHFVNYIFVSQIKKIRLHRSMRRSNLHFLHSMWDISHLVNKQDPFITRCQPWGHYRTILAFIHYSSPGGFSLQNVPLLIREEIIRIRSNPKYLYCWQNIIEALYWTRRKTFNKYFYISNDCMKFIIKCNA